MSYQSLNPYVTNIVPLYNVASSASGPILTTVELSNVQTLLNFSNKTLSINTINTYTNGATLQIGNNTNINGKLSLNTYLIGPDTSGISINTCKRFLISTPTTTVTVNNKVDNTYIPFFGVYINNINSFSIDSNGYANFTNPVSAPAFNVISDVRYKSGIESLTNSLSTVCELEGKQYMFDGVSSIGFIAQDLDLVIPSAVDKTNADKWSINYMHIIPHLVESIKELNIKVALLESKLKVTK